MHDTATLDDQPTLNSLTDIVPDFPLEANEVILVRDGHTEDHVLFPSSIVPTGRTSSSYDVGVKRANVIRDIEEGPVIEPTFSNENEIPIKSFFDLIDRETVITKRDFLLPSTAPDKQATLHFDGASRGNPGPASTGYILDIEGDSDPIRDGHSIGEKTNNLAEYHALLQGLKRAAADNVTDIIVRGDSELIIKQVRGDYDCNSDNLVDALEAVREQLDAFDSWSLEHVPRSENRDADHIANNVLDTLNRTGAEA